VPITGVKVGHRQTPKQKAHPSVGFFIPSGFMASTMGWIWVG